jgi:hypothetical protein
MLRACSVKAVGVMLLGAAVLIYAILLLVVVDVHYSRGLHQGLEVGLHGVLLCVLGILGQCAPVYPYVDMSGLSTLLTISVHLLF